VVEDPPPGVPSVNFEPIEPVRAHEYVAEQLRHHIALGIVPVGSSLPTERELAQMFKVGRTTIQAALRMLESDHLIETRRGRGGGTFVVEPVRDRASHERLLLELRLSAAKIEDAVRFRRILEEGAVAEAARVADEDGIKALRALSAQMKQTLDARQFHHLDTEFHIRLAKATGIAHLRDAVEQIRVTLNQAIWAQPGSTLWHERINAEHDKIIAAIAASDPVAAISAMSEHLSHTEAGVRSLIASLT
jgi:GntR family transcriptional repressor for pyruvate dehydrogenase complex